MWKSYSRTKRIHENREADKMSKERDKAIFDVVAKAYAFQFDYRERLDSKLNNFIIITATIATLNVGIGFFVFDKVSTGNPFYPYLILTFLFGLGFFVSALLRGLLGYKPKKYRVFPEDPERIIEKYKSLTETHLIRQSAASLARATNWNKEVNYKKVGTIHWVFRLVVLGIVTMLFFTILMVFALVVPPPVDPTNLNTILNYILS